MSDPYLEMADRLLDQIPGTIDQATKSCSEAKRLMDKSSRTYDADEANLWFQAAHQSMLNAVVTSNMAIATELRGLREWLEAQKDV
jgi:hypothetical protein